MNYIKSKGNLYSELITSSLFYYILLVPMLLRLFKSMSLCGRNTI